MRDTHYLLLSTAVTWLAIMAAATIRNREWTLSGLRIGFGNRDVLPEPTALSGRAERAAKNMFENLVLFVAVFVACHAVEKAEPLGAAIFFFARLAYWVVYLVGIPYLRTFLWFIGIMGTAMVGFRAVG